MERVDTKKSPEAGTTDVAMQTTRAGRLDQGEILGMASGMVTPATECWT